jgi:hypothetical protein
MKNNKLDAWGDHVEEYSKRQKQLHQELVDKKLMEMELENTTSEKTNITENDSNIQTQPDLIWMERKANNTTWTENKRWTAAVIGLLCVIGFMSALVIYNLFWYVLVSIFGVWLLGVMLVASKDIVDDLIDEW